MRDVGKGGGRFMGKEGAGVGGQRTKNCCHMLILPS